jgi:hypothetical protein
MPYGFNDNKSKFDIEEGLAAKANIDSPMLTGSPKAPTASAGTNTTQIATTEFVQNAISGKQNMITVSSNAPSGGNNGDIWIQY